MKRTIEAQDAKVVALDVNLELARDSGPNTVVARLPDIPLSANSVDGVYSVLVLEYVAGHADFFRECARVTRPGGVLALVVNHPVWTAPGSTPITDSDGEVFWRPGDYFSEGLTEVSAGLLQVKFHHRTMADLLNSATDSGWALQHMIEKPHHELMDQAGVPRLLACRWTLQV